MEITANEKGELILKKVYSGIVLEAGPDEFFGICMRDGGFEFNYNGTWFTANHGKVEQVFNKVEKPILARCGSDESCSCK
jgi:hypothetical protein